MFARVRERERENEEERKRGRERLMINDNAPLHTQKNCTKKGAIKPKGDL